MLKIKYTLHKIVEVNLHPINIIYERIIIYIRLLFLIFYNKNNYSFLLSKAILSEIKTKMYIYQNNKNYL